MQFSLSFNHGAEPLLAQVAGDPSQFSVLHHPANSQVFEADQLIPRISFVDMLCRKPV